MTPIDLRKPASLPLFYEARARSRLHPLRNWLPGQGRTSVQWRGRRSTLGFCLLAALGLLALGRSLRLLRLCGGQAPLTRVGIDELLGHLAGDRVRTLV